MFVLIRYLTDYLLKNINSSFGVVSFGAELERFFERFVIHLRPVSTVKRRLQPVPHQNTRRHLKHYVHAGKTVKIKDLVRPSL